MVLKRRKADFVSGKAMRPGVRMPGVAGGTLGLEPISTAEAWQRFHAAWTRASTSDPTTEHPIFGVLTGDEFRAIHLHHAELHLSFFKVR
jgi:hypothetical protein